MISITRIRRTRIARRHNYISVTDTDYRFSTLEANAHGIHCQQPASTTSTPTSISQHQLQCLQITSSASMVRMFGSNSCTTPSSYTGGVSRILCIYELVLCMLFALHNNNTKHMHRGSVRNLVYSSICMRQCYACYSTCTEQ